MYQRQRSLSIGRAKLKTGNLQQQQQQPQLELGYVGKSASHQLGTSTGATVSGRIPWRSLCSTVHLYQYWDCGERREAVHITWYSNSSITKPVRAPQNWVSPLKILLKLNFFSHQLIELALPLSNV